MKFLPLIWSGIWRKPGRTILALMQVSVAFALFGVLQGMKTGVEEAIARVRGDVLFVFASRFRWSAAAPRLHRSTQVDAGREDGCVRRRLPRELSEAHAARVCIGIPRAMTCG